jgi:hypothetical protein
VLVKGAVASQIDLNDTTTVCIPECHAGAVDAKSNDGDVYRTLEQLIDFGVSMLLVVVAAATSGYYRMLDARPYIGNIKTYGIGLWLGSGMIPGDGGYVQTAVAREARWRGVRRPLNKDVLKRIHEQ